MTPSESMQNIDTRGNSQFDRLEVLGYSYRISKPVDWKDILMNHANKQEQEWWLKECNEREIGGMNPGTSWHEWPTLWEKFLVKPDPQSATQFAEHFDYTYSERLYSPEDPTAPLSHQFIICARELMLRPNSRRAVVSIWDRRIDGNRVDGKPRVPCTMYYHFVRRDNKLHMMYHMRSCDLALHFPFDVAFAMAARDYVMTHISKDMEPGWFQHNFGSLHAYRKDLEGVF